MRAISITVDLMFLLKVLITNKIKTHIINTSNANFKIVKFFTEFDTLFWPIFVGFRTRLPVLI